MNLFEDICKLWYGILEGCGESGIKIDVQNIDICDVIKQNESEATCYWFRLALYFEHTSVEFETRHL